MTTPEPLQGDAAAAPRLGLERRVIAAFDFDGTLTVKDSFTAFLRWRTRGWRWPAALLRLAPAALVYLAKRDRGRLKAEAVRMFLRGLPRDALTREAAAFAEAQAGRMLRPDALQVWAAHRAAGDLLVIVTASPETTVAPFAARLGADALIGTRLSWTSDDRVGDGLQGPNCRGPEKVRRLRAVFGEAVEIADAYGDTSGDCEMLTLAKRGHMKRFTGRPRR